MNTMIEKQLKVKLTSKNGVYVDSLEAAREEFLRFIAANNFSSSELCRGAGLVTCEGKAVARISYNGRIWTPERTGYRELPCAS